MGSDIDGEILGEEFKGYTLRITGVPNIPHTESLGNNPQIVSLRNLRMHI